MMLLANSISPIKRGRGHDTFESCGDLPHPLAPSPCTERGNRGAWHQRKIANMGMKPKSVVSPTVYGEGSAVHDTPTGAEPILKQVGGTSLRSPLLQRALLSWRCYTLASAFSIPKNQGDIGWHATLRPLKP